MKKAKYVSLFLLGVGVAAIEIARHGVSLFYLAVLPLTLAALYSIIFWERIRQRPWLYCSFYFALILIFMNTAYIPFSH